MSDPLASTTLSYAAYAEIPADGQLTASARGDGPLVIADLAGVTIALDRLWLS